MNLFSTIENKGMASNLVYAVLAQGMGLLSSFVMSLVVPKLLGLEDYAYWQLFLMYSSYAGLALFGINDGIYLRLGGKRFNELDKGELKGHLFVVATLELAIGVMALLGLNSLAANENRSFVYLSVVVSGLVANVTVYISYIFQSTNLTQISSISTMSSKALFLLCSITALFMGSSSYIPFIIAYIFCQILSLIYCLVCARTILLAKAYFGITTLRTCLGDMVAGTKIMIAYYADMLIVGLSRMLTDWNLGIAVFGTISFSFSITNFVLSFIGQVAMVVFPVLKRLDASHKKSKYSELRGILLIILPLAYLGYVPMRILLGMWLPEYSKSLVFLALTLPLCVYSSKANFLFNTYYKIEREEGLLCAVNVCTMLLNAGLSAIFILVFKSVELSAVGIVLSVCFRNFIFERHFSLKYKTKYLTGCLSEMILAMVFMAVSRVMGNISIVAVAASLAVYYVVNRDYFNAALDIIRDKIN